MQGLPRPCDGLECLDVEITCPGVIEPLAATLHVGQVAGPPLGTVLFFSGGAGTGDWVGTDVTAAQVVTDVRAAGFRTVQVQWDTGWLEGESPNEGHAALACRPATVAAWIHQSALHDADGAFCATGNSGGASEIAYMLSHYGLDDVLDLVVATEGPPTARIDLGCIADDPQDEPFRYVPDAARRIDLGFGFETNGPCARGDASFEERFEEESVITPGGDYRHPSTTVRFLLGDRSDSEAQAHATAYHDLLRSQGTDTSLEIVERTPHRVQSTIEGATAIRDRILLDCRPRG